MACNSILMKKIEQSRAALFCVPSPTNGYPEVCILGRGRCAQIGLQTFRQTMKISNFFPNALPDLTVWRAKLTFTFPPLQRHKKFCQKTTSKINNACKIKVACFFMLYRTAAGHLSVTVPSQDMNFKLTGPRRKWVEGDGNKGVQLGTLTAVAPQKFSRYFYYPSHRNQPLERVPYEGIARFSQKWCKMHLSAVLKSTMSLGYIVPLRYFL